MLVDTTTCLQILQPGGLVLKIKNGCKNYHTIKIATGLTYKLSSLALRHRLTTVLPKYVVLRKGFFAFCSLIILCRNPFVKHFLQLFLKFCAQYAQRCYLYCIKRQILSHNHTKIAYAQACARVSETAV